MDIKSEFAADEKLLYIWCCEAKASATPGSIPASITKKTKSNPFSKNRNLPNSPINIKKINCNRCGYKGSMINGSLVGTWPEDKTAIE